MSSNSGNSSSGGRQLPFDPSLLAPIVRSKRTPMACVECRRRQVKCSGTTPRCERCQKKGIECVYMSLSEQRAVSGGSISRSGTPQATRGTSAHGQQQHSNRSAHAGQWAQGTQGYPAGTAYPAPQGWRAPDDAQGQYVPQPGQAFPNVQMGFPQSYAQQAAYAQAHGGSTVPNGAGMYPQGYGAAAQQGYASGTTYPAYGQTIAPSDPRYAYQAAQMGGVMGGEQQA
ncbi:hypothetical protein C8Q73DRAFT_507499 [Cubamyces lactineus]|nr:hypothetical protein C8Q73DRAFT_507499 [Cubamyces lactineus]